MNHEITLGDASLDDAPAIAEIYSHYVLESTASFETEPPDTDEMAGRIEQTLAAGYPWLVVRDLVGKVLGYAHAHRFGPRNGYAYSCETNIYVRQDSIGQGVGTTLINALLAACEARGYRQAFAMIAGTEPASVVLHARAGFLPVGTLTSAGWKHGKWIDVFIMQRKLGEGDESLPESA
ncbi:GNAT family N-acetyltransferase [Novosphingobium album (ex Liu et al. 2023)]|uniref:GNAT family N-acetyltransferase n=1 Tax=Novosphingobium album (ex Liu et al. 2023) TaxID=3031130 RepID=A0ABT5WJP4_9SPHN|nr:GNAT family N-acetyltransferase [Novosphingobium album (ex Liu et al. 2023)]MDE8650267.1 GNAT family N-acetyltransferase [Novosphingobium album (ex Liu et al. 2023)]